MATGKYGAIITDIKGKIGGTVFKGTKSGAAIQNKTRKRSSSTSSGKLTKADAGRTIANQRNLGAIATAWRALDQADRDAWIAAAPDFPFINRFGESYTGSGYQLYMQCNTNILNVGATVIDVPPSTAPIADTPVFTIAPTAGPPGFISIDYTDVADYTFVLYATGNISPGRMPQSGMYKAISVIPAGTALPFDISADYERVFGTRPASGNIWFSGKLTKADAGRQAQPLTVQYSY